MVNQLVPATLVAEVLSTYLWSATEVAGTCYLWSATEVADTWNLT